MGKRKYSSANLPDKAENKAHEAARLFSLGYDVNDIAKRFEMSREYVSKAIMKSPAFVQHYKMIQEEADKKTIQGIVEAKAILVSESAGAARRIVDMSKNANNEKVRLNANEAILDGAGVLGSDVSGMANRAQFNIHIENFQAATTEQLDQFLLERLNPVMDVAFQRK